jgi:hypothetical protein
MNTFLKDLIKLSSELNEVSGFDAIVVMNEIEILYDRHVCKLQKEAISDFKQQHFIATSRYDPELFKPPFRLGKKQKRAVLDSIGREVIIMPHDSEKQAQMYCDYLNGYSI